MVAGRCSVTMAELLSSREGARQAQGTGGKQHGGETEAPKPAISALPAELFEVICPRPPGAVRRP
jgi:hypothetical protein